MTTSDVFVARRGGPDTTNEQTRFHDLLADEIDAAERAVVMNESLGLWELAESWRSRVEHLLAYRGRCSLAQTRPSPGHR